MSKYNAKKTIIDGITFDSKKEAAYYMKLKALKKAKNETDRVVLIEFQPKFPYSINYQANEKVYRCKAFYKADFKVTYADKRVEIVDVKGFKTATYKRKKRIIERLYDFKIIEV